MNIDLDDLQDLIDSIDEGTVTPIISNSFRIAEIFRDDDDLVDWVRGDQLPAFYDEVHTIEHQLARRWAGEIGYPMSDGYNLARVAQYLQAEDEDPDKVKREYITFLNQQLIALGIKKQRFEEGVSPPKPNSRSLSEMVRELDYPAFPDGMEDPLLLLAQLPLPIYITTSYSDFLERALIKAGKNPRRQLCFYAGQNVKDLNKHLPDVDFNPDPNNPAVYYLFGMEDYRPTMVLSEDDYLDFLMRADAGIETQDLFPTPLRMALSQSRLLLLGYHLRDWDFRTLFRLILKTRQKVQQNSSPSIAIQFKPSLGKKVDNANDPEAEPGEAKYTEAKSIESKSTHYLEQYFGAQKFKIRWSDTEKFIYDLWNAWRSNSEPS